MSVREVLQRIKNKVVKVPGWVYRSLPVVNTLAIIYLVLASNNITARMELQIGLIIQDIMIDQAHFTEFMKRFGGSGQGS
jgi:hypothetical protein